MKFLKPLIRTDLMALIYYCCLFPISIVFYEIEP